MNLITKTSFLLCSIFIAANLTFISCKDENNDPAGPSKPLLASRSSYSQDGKMHETEAFQYDSKGRLIQVNISDKYKTTLEYSELKVIVKDYYKDSLDETQIFQLNDKGLSISTDWEGDNTTFYTFDTNGYLQTTVDKEENSTITQTYTVYNQNYVTITLRGVHIIPESDQLKEQYLLDKLHMSKTINSTLVHQNKLKSAQDWISSYKTDYEFYTDKTNTIDFENMGIYFMGKQNKNPVKKETETSVDWPARISAYSYEYDSKGRITKKIYDSGGYDVFTYVQ